MPTRIRTAPVFLAALLAALFALSGCSSSGTLGDLRHPPASNGDDIVGSILDPARSSKGGVTGTAHDGGISQQSLPSFDNAPLPATVTANQIPGPYTSDDGAVTGKIFFYKKGQEDSGDYFVCSGTVVKSANRSLVWTAGHCVHDGKDGTWHSEMVFVPGFSNTSGDTNIDPADLSAYAPLGVFPATHAWTSTEWVKTGDDHGGDLAHDYGVLEVGRNDRGQTLDDAIEQAGAGKAVPIWFNAAATAATSVAMSIKGYPAAPPFDGMSQFACAVGSVQLLTVSELGPTAKEYRAGCDLTGGASGGGWFARAPGQPAGEVSLVTNTSVGSAHTQRSWLAGPYLDGEAQALFQKADSSPAP